MGPFKHYISTKGAGGLDNDYVSIIYFSTFSDFLQYLIDADFKNMYKICLNTRLKIALIELN